MRFSTVFGLLFLAVLVSTATGLSGPIPEAANLLEPAAPANDGGGTGLVNDVPIIEAGASPRVNGLNDGTTPTITDFYPVVAYRGSTGQAAVVGTGFLAGTRVVIAGGGQMINATDCVVMSGSTAISCTLEIPATAYIGTWDVRVQNPGMTEWVSKAGALDMQDTPSPTVTGLSPDPVYRGSITSMKVNVYGTNFLDGAQVVLAGGGQTIEAFGESVWSGEVINCDVFIPTNAYLGTWDIRVKNPGSTTWVTRPNAFTMKDTPTITGISPSSAPQGSTVTETLTGSIFATGIDICAYAPGLTTIWATNITFVNENQVRCTLAIPANAYIGGYFLSIANPGMTYRVEMPAGFFTVTPGATPTPTVTPTLTVTPTVTATLTPAPTEVYAVLRTWGTNGTGTGQFKGPGGIALDPSGNVWVADTGNNRVQKFDRNGTFLSQIGGIGGSGLGQLLGPGGIAVDNASNVFVADTGNNRVQMFNSTGTFLSLIGGLAGPGIGQFLHPAGIAVDTTNTVHVADTGNNRVQTFNTTGTFLSQIGGLGGALGQMMGPGGIAVDNASNIFIADTGNNRVQVFSPNGSYAGQIGGGLGGAIGQLLGPQGLTVDNQSNVYVADTGNNRVQKFGKNGTFLGQIGGDGRSASTSSARVDGIAPGTFSGPGGIAIDSSGNVYVADTGNDRVQVFAPVSLPPGVVQVPTGVGLPTDTNADTRFDDVNGNGRRDFADVVLYFNQMTWIAAHEPLAAFDYNGNGRIDFADVVWLFTHL